MILSATVPAFVERSLPEAANAYLARAGLRPQDVARYVCHPGGAKVVPAIEAALQLPPGARWMWSARCWRNTAT